MNNATCDIFTVVVRYDTNLPVSSYRKATCCNNDTTSHLLLLLTRADQIPHFSATRCETVEFIYIPPLTRQQPFTTRQHGGNQHNGCRDGLADQGDPSGSAGGDAHHQTCDISLSSNSNRMPGWHGLWRTTSDHELLPISCSSTRYFGFARPVLPE